MVSSLMVSLVIMVEALAGKAEDFLKYLTEEAADVIAHEPGCLHFFISRSKADPNLFTLAEFYVNEAALELHRQTPHFILFQERVKGYGLIASKTPVLGDVVFPV